MKITKELKLVIISWVLVLTGIVIVHVCYVGANIVPIKAVKVQPVIYKKIIKKPILHKKKKLRYNFTKTDIKLLAQLTCGDKNIDGDGEYDIDYQKHVNYYELYKVLCIVMNRVRSNSFPDTVRGVVLQKHQFDVIPRNLNCEPSDKAIYLVKEWCQEYNNYNKNIQVVPRNHLFYEGNGVCNITRISWR